MSSPRKRGPIRRGLAFWHSGRRLPLQQTTVVMGPCFRRDDASGFNCQTAAIISRHTFAISPRLSREFCRNVLPSEFRRRRECRAPAAPAASCAVCRKHTSVVTTVTPVHPAFPAQWFQRFPSRSPEIGLSCLRRLRKCIRKLDAGVEASGPHDFTVRSKHLSSARPVIAHGKTRPAITHVPNAAASTASRAQRP